MTTKKAKIGRPRNDSVLLNRALMASKRRKIENSNLIKIKIQDEDDPDYDGFDEEFLERVRVGYKFSITKVLKVTAELLTESHKNAQILDIRAPHSPDYIDGIPPMTSLTSEKKELVDTAFEGIIYDPRGPKETDANGRIKRPKEEPTEVELYRRKIEIINSKRYQEWSSKATAVAKVAVWKVFKPIMKCNRRLIIEPTINMLNEHYKGLRLRNELTHKIMPLECFDETLDRICRMASSTMSGEFLVEDIHLDLLCLKNVHTDLVGKVDLMSTYVW